MRAYCPHAPCVLAAKGSHEGLCLSLSSSLRGGAAE